MMKPIPIKIVQQTTIETVEGRVKPRAVHRWEVTREGKIIATYATRKEARAAAQQERAKP